MKPQKFVLFVIVFVALVALAPQSTSAMTAQPPTKGQIVLQDGANPCEGLDVAKSDIRALVACLLWRLQGGTNVLTTGQNAQVTGTDCTAAEKLVTGKGIPSDPFVYPTNYLHDLCEGSANGGTGAKYVKIEGPTALQMGEATGPFRMVYVPSGTTFTGWTQGGWKYVSNDALLVQWRVEDATNGKWGLICGYERNNHMFSPAYRWDGTRENRDQTLDCTIALPQLLGTIAAPNPLASVAASTQDFQNYPEIFKVEYNGVFYCGARATNASYPDGTRRIETYPKGSNDGNFLHDSSQYGMSYAGYCKGQPVDAAGKPVTQQTWTTVLLTTQGYVPTQFPLQ